MTTASHTSLLLLLLALITLAPPISASPNLLNLHQLLQLQGFPPGLIPDPIEDFAISLVGLLPPTFNFTVLFKNPCYVQFVIPNYFAPVFTGTMTFGKISGMIGHKDQFSSGEWIDMYDVTVVGQYLVFTYETTTLTYHRSLFEEVKTCTDGPLLPDHSNELISQLPISVE